MAKLELALAAGLLLAIRSASAADMVINAPSPWLVEEPIDHASGTTAAAVTSPDGGHGVLLNKAGTTLVLPMPERVFHVQVAPDGAHVRACSIVPTVLDGCGSTSRCKVFDDTGAVVDDRTWGPNATFSSDSARLVAWNGDASADAAEISVHELSGTRLAGLKPHRRLYGVVGLSAPARLVLAGRGGVECIDPTLGPSGVAWRHALVGEEYGINGLGLVGSNLIVIHQSFGWWKLLDHSGAVRFTWNPRALSTADPVRSWADYAQYRPYETTSPDWVVIFNASPEAFMLHVPTAQRTPVSLDVAVPSGFARQAGLRDGRLVFHSSSSIRLRAVRVP